MLVMKNRYLRVHIIHFTAQIDPANPVNTTQVYTKHNISLIDDDAWETVKYIRRNDLMMHLGFSDMQNIGHLWD